MKKQTFVVQKHQAKIEEMMSTPEGMEKLGNVVRPIFLPGMGYALMKISDDDCVPDICLTCKKWIYDDRYPLWYCGGGKSQIYCSEIQESGICDEYEEEK